MSPNRRREMVYREHPSLPTVRQCAPRLRWGRLCWASAVPASTTVPGRSLKRTCP